jgi:hypothetical protein
LNFFIDYAKPATDDAGSRNDHWHPALHGFTRDDLGPKQLVAGDDRYGQIRIALIECINAHLFGPFVYKVAQLAAATSML